MGKVAELTVAQMGKIGAFLDWGLEKASSSATSVLSPSSATRGTSTSSRNA